MLMIYLVPLATIPFRQIRVMIASLASKVMIN